MSRIRQKETVFEYISVQVVAVLVLANGIYLVLSTLFSSLLLHHFRRNEFGVDAYLLIGLTLIYLANLLWRRKQTAWVFAMFVYALYLGLSIGNLLSIQDNHLHHALYILLRDLIFPVVTLVGLIFARNAYDVKSDIRSFGFAVRTILIVYLVALLFGVIGFQLMDNSDFHQELSIPTSIHRTIDQFGLTSNTQLVPYTRRAKIFLDSLAVVSIGATVYAVLSLFQPLRAKFSDQSKNRKLAESIINSHHGTSDDFFKLWPHDKDYFFFKIRKQWASI